MPTLNSDVDDIPHVHYLCKKCFKQDNVKCKKKMFQSRYM